MELFVNGTSVEVSLENEKTIGDVLKAFEEDCQKNDATTVSIEIDGQQVSAADFDTFAAKEIKEDTKISLGVVSLVSIEKAFEEEKKFSRKIANELKELSVKLQSGKDKEANLIITALADLIDNVCHTASLSVLFPEKFEKIKIEDKSISEFFGEFSAILSDFEKAIEASDTVMMGDLAEYEISPRLEQLADALEIK